MVRVKTLEIFYLSLNSMQRKGDYVAITLQGSQ